MRVLLVFLIFLLPGLAAANEAVYRFVWEGGGGYRMEGALAFDPAKAAEIVRESDLSCFQVEGFAKDESLGHLDLSKLGPGTVWRLHFLPRDNRFLVDGEWAWMPQAWNMHGDGTGCGAGGFGFNLGNVAQDICVDDALVIESQANPAQPFPAQRVQSFPFRSGACRGPMLLGQLEAGVTPPG